MSAFFNNMNLFDKAISDIKKITSDSIGGFGVSFVMVAPNIQTATLTGIHAKHHLGIDTDGVPVNSKKATISFSEGALMAVNPSYPLRNVNGEVDLNNHKINVKDSTGIVKYYNIQQWFPDEALGLITCILEDFE